MSEQVATLRELTPRSSLFQARWKSDDAGAGGGGCRLRGRPLRPSGRPMAFEGLVLAGGNAIGTPGANNQVKGGLSVVLATRT